MAVFRGNRVNGDGKPFRCRVGMILVSFQRARQMGLKGKTAASFPVTGFTV